MRRMSRAWRRAICSWIRYLTTPIPRPATRCGAGLPLITCRGQAFAGRVAASLLRAAGLAELITASLEEYESLALRLANDRALLQSYRDRLTRDPARLALFDTARTTRRIEAAYEQMMARRAQDLPPAAFDVPE